MLHSGIAIATSMFISSRIVCTSFPLFIKLTAQAKKKKKHSNLVQDTR